MVQGSVASGTEGGAASLTPKRLDWFGLATLAISDERMDLIISIAEVLTLLIGTGKALGIHALGGSPAAFHLAPGTHRSRRWPCTRRGSGAETTGGAVK